MSSVFLPSLDFGYNFMLIIVLMMMRFFPFLRAKLFTGKLGSQEISNFIPPCVKPYFAILLYSLWYVVCKLPMSFEERKRKKVFYSLLVWAICYRHMKCWKTLANYLIQDDKYGRNTRINHCGNLTNQNNVHPLIGVLASYVTNLDLLLRLNWTKKLKISGCSFIMSYRYPFLQPTTKPPNHPTHPEKVV